ncbi:ABC transporter substrate-binding protein [Paenibacillus rubinfantis]|uniref:ABC transporter substrate-binding protein n=1 Tax=Paenibacillus rubinfantis TaxID=1720296 RepID=UPI00073E698F|nr:ABC transporter substrate-binding protein [Paenibacillus rubinfantis]
MRIPKFMLMLAVVCMVFVATGCTGSSKSGDDTNANAQGKVKLVLWSHQEDQIVNAYKEIISKYEALHPETTIEYQTFPYDVYNQKLKASFSAATPPDVAEMFGTWVPNYSRNDLLVEIPDSETVKQAYYEAPLGGYLRDGKLYGLPLEYNIENGGMLIHPQMLKEQGYDQPPSTWTELVEYAKKLTVKNGNALQVKGFDFVSSDNITFTFLSLILQQNASFWGENEHVNFSTSEAEKAMSALVSLIADDQVADLTTFGGELDTSDYFFRGNSAMTYRGPWTIAAGLNNYKVNDFEYVPVPSFTDNPPSFAAESGWGLTVAKQSKQQEAALDFIRFFSEKENLESWNTETFTVPAKKEIAEDPEYLKNNPYMKTPLEVLSLGQWIGPVADRDYFFKQVNDHFQLMVTGRLSVKEGLAKIEQAINDNQDQHKR